MGQDYDLVLAVERPAWSIFNFWTRDPQASLGKGAVCLGM